jgi:hypothetical protein
MPVLRADRVFRAGPSPLDSSTSDYLWIVDFKTAEVGGRDLHTFLSAEQAKYTPQMQAYAAASLSAGHDLNKIILALYFPLISEMVYWPADIAQ